MNKIFGYELRRLLWNKLFFGVLSVTLGYGWLMLTGSVIRGVAHTACKCQYKNVGFMENKNVGKTTSLFSIFV